MQGHAPSTVGAVHSQTSSTNGGGEEGVGGQSGLVVAAVALRAGREVLGSVLEDLAGLSPVRR